MKQKSSFFNKFLNGIEKVGNKLPDPFVLFAIFAFIVIIASYILHLFDLSVIHPGTGEELKIKSLASGEGIQFILQSMIENFTGFAPLGIVLAMMLGVGLADKVGFLDYTVRHTIMKSPRFLITYTVVFMGIMGNLASDAANVLIPPLTALVFHKLGRHPIAGLVAGFAGVAAGFTANLSITGMDAQLAGLSTEAAAIIDDSITVTPADNWYFSIVSVFILTLVGGLITDRVVEPRLGKYKGDYVDVEETESEEDPRSRKAFRNALISGFVYLIIIFIAIIWPDSPLRNEDGGMIPSPFLEGIVPIILFFFMTIGIAFGITNGKIKSTKDFGHYMSESIKDLSSYIVLIFAIAQFIAYFNWTNIGTWIAVNGADLLTDIEFTGAGLIIGYIIFTALMNFLITSGSAKWALEAPIFVPLFMQLGYHPAFTQVAYRVADSSTNVITPLYPYLVVILAFMQRYDKKAGLGTLISLMLPYSIAFLVTWIILVLVFFYGGIPFGPGVTPYL